MTQTTTTTQLTDRGLLRFPRRVPREGYSAGFVSGDGTGKWLTILGSYWDSTPPLHATESAARAAMPAELAPHIADGMVIRYVRETYRSGVTGNGRAYRVVDAVTLAQHQETSR